MSINAQLLSLVHQVRVNGYEVQIDDEGNGPIGLTIFSTFGEPELQITFFDSQEAEIREQIIESFLTPQQALRFVALPLAVA